MSLEYNTPKTLTETFALVRGPVNEDFRTYHSAKRHEHLHQLAVAKLLGQMVDEQVATFRARYGAAWWWW